LLPKVSGKCDGGLASVTWENDVGSVMTESVLWEECDVHRVMWEGEGMCDMAECEVMWENVRLGVMWGHRGVYTM